ncbi:MAG TPA: FG-GAP-like repeat-containing protein [Verrucomicrobiae bacterium]|nr:FG-GAP-like repeat-containing protein [Verrucomicrobiae bacterium]
MYPFVRLVVLGFCLLETVASNANADAGYQSPGTKRMAERLQQWHREFGERNAYENRARVKELQAELPQAREVSRRIAMQYELALEQLNLGDPEATLTTLTNLNREARAARVRISVTDRRDIRLLEGLAYLRLGELENCVHHHNPESCLLPIRGAGEHLQRRGAENAEMIFRELAEQKTNDLGARWLLNLSAMTLGKYPAEVPASLRIPESVFESEAPFPKFAEMGTRLGLGENALAGGTLTEDFDGDGLVDVFLSKWNTVGQCALYRNLGNGHFIDITRKAGLEGVTGGLNIMQADYNNDGYMDVYVVRGAWLGEMGLIPDSLLRNNGDGTFDDVTEETGLLSMHPALSATWFDANNDGWIDLFVGNETTTPEFPHPCQLFINQRNGTFKEAAQPANAAIVGFVRGVSAGDFDNDGRPDLYISRLNQENILLHNESTVDRVRFTDVTAQFGVAEPRMSFPTWFWDYNNDGWLDIWVSGYGDAPRGWYSATLSHVTLGEWVADKLGLPSKAETFRLYRNDRGHFTDVTRAANLKKSVLAMSANFGDLDNDGYLDFYTGTGAPSYGSLVPNEMFRNDGGSTFKNITTAGGFGHLQKGHAIAFADLNNDGAQEVVVNVGGGYAGDTFYDALFVNPGTTNSWVSLKFVGKQSNRAAIGTRVKVVASAKGAAREIHRVVGSGGSFGSSPLRQDIGLGQCDKIERVEVWWPASGQTNVLTSLKPSQFYEITEGKTEARLLAPHRFAWPNPKADDESTSE